ALRPRGGRARCPERQAFQTREPIHPGPRVHRKRVPHAEALHHGRHAVALERTRAVLFPPNPNEFDTTTESRRASPPDGTCRIGISGSGSSSPAVAGTNPLERAMRLRTLSMAPAAPRV